MVGTNCEIADPDRIHIPRISEKCHGGFIPTHRHQGITCIAPPVWVWSDYRRLSGAWFIVATTGRVDAGTTTVTMSNLIQNRAGPDEHAHRLLQLMSYRVEHK